jgi:RNA polymerase sigma-70 factor (sigma-E family)
VNASTQIRRGQIFTEFVEYVQIRRAMWLRLANAITGNVTDAEDLVQITLLKTYLAWDKIADKRAIDAYVRKIMANSCISSWRRQKIAEYPMVDLPDCAAVSDPFAEYDIRQTLLTALSKLSKRQRAIVMLRYYADLTEAETAAALRVSVGTVKSTMHHALAKLRADATLRAQIRPDEPRLAMAS